MVFLVEFERSFIFQGFDGIFEWYEVIFGVVGMGKNSVKWAFCRTHYRTRNGGRGVGTSDMPFPAIEHLF